MSQKNYTSALEGFVAEIEVAESEPSSVPKMWILVRKELDITVPKFAAQVGHAVCTCVIIQERKDSTVVDAYLAAAQPKIVVRVDGVAHMEKVVQACKEVEVAACIVQDAGRTEFDSKTITVGAIGPCSKQDLPAIARRLRLLKASPRNSVLSTFLTEG